MFMTKEEAANCKEAAMPVESEAEYLVWSKITKGMVVRLIDTATSQSLV